MERRDLPRKMIRPTGLIDSESFPYYLLGFRNFHSSDQKFAHRLHLPHFREGIDELYGVKVKKPIYEGTDIVSKIAGEKLAKEFDWSEVDDAERGRLFYFDTNIWDLGMTDVVVGEEFGKVKAMTGLQKVIIDGNIPLMDVHTHPNNFPFSPADYAAIMSDSSTGMPFVSASMVLCPDNQVLALRTAQTPVLSFKRMDEIMEQEREKDIFDEDPQLRSLQGEFQRSNIVSRDRKPTKIKSYFEQKRDQMIAKMKTEGLSKEEMINEVEALGARYSAALMRYNNVLKAWIKSSTTQYADLYNRLLITKLIEFPRRYNIQLYMSSDRTNFERFSA
jgi:hypothetical protein